jgi:DinB superfamily
LTSLIPAARSMLAATPGRWSALATVDAALLARRPAPGEWSATQCLQHVVDTEHTAWRARHGTRSWAS